MESIIRAEKFNPSNVSYSDLKKTPSGGKSVYMNNGDTQGIVMQTPSMKCPFGIKSFDEESQKFTLELSFGQNFEENKSNKGFHDALDKFDEKILEDGVENSMSWFSKKGVSKDVLKALYTPQLRVSKDRETGEPDGKYPPTFRLKIPYYDGQWQCKIYDENKNKIEDDLRDILVAGCEVKALVKCGGLWFVSGKYGCTWKALQLIVKRPQGFTNYAFIDSDVDDDENDGGAIDELDDGLIESSEEGSEAEDEPEPVKKKVKKTKK